MPTDAARSPTANATLALLWERMRRQGDMPGFTRAINAILGSMHGEHERDFSMTQTVLSDPVLTQKVLRLANSSMYAAFGQHINTVTKAVLVLGTEAIGHLALGLKLVEELSRSHPDSALAHAEMEKAVLAGMVAQQVAAGMARRDPEEAVVCAILHSLGSMMVTFYLPERWDELTRLAAAGGEEAAAHAVLGLSLEELGRAAAEHWNLPRNLINGMRKVAPDARGEHVGHDDWLAAIGTMSNQCADSLWNDDEAGAARVRGIAASFGPMLGIEPDNILVAVEKAKTEAVTDLTIAPLARPEKKRARELAGTRKRVAGNKVLTSGVTELREALGQVSSTQVLSMALETVHLGLSFSRSFGFLRNRRERRYRARIGLGLGAREMLPDLFFGDRYESNVFHAALSSDRVIYIANPHDPKFASNLPGWWKSALGAGRSFVILPLSTSGQPAGFLYGEWHAGQTPATLGPAEIALLNDVRGLLAHSLEQRPQIEATASR
jgi:HD-like signal output (HDOD) protein